MNKLSLSQEVASCFHRRVTQKLVEGIIDTTLSVIKSELSEGGKITIRGFGTFKLKRTKERIGRNPKTGEEVVIEARDRVVFKMSPMLKYLEGPAPIKE